MAPHHTMPDRTMPYIFRTVHFRCMFLWLGDAQEDSTVKRGGGGRGVSSAGSSGGQVRIFVLLIYCCPRSMDAV